MALLVAHGLGRTAAEWLACARAIDDDAIVVDLPELRRVDRAPDTEAVIASLLDELDRRALADAVWLGHSGGAHVMLDAAIAHPRRVRQLVLVGAIPSRAKLAAVRCDVLVVLGASEQVALPGVRVAIVGSGHDPHLEAPDAFVATVRAAVQRQTT